jgi:hypothetical protein
MTTLELNDEEQAELTALVTNHMLDLRVEITGTNSFALRAALTRRAIVLKRLLDSLGEPEAQSAASRAPADSRGRPR